MILDYNPANAQFILHLPRGEGDPETFRLEHGMEISRPASTLKEAVLFTARPYAAATFLEFATPLARAQLGWIGDRVEASRRDTSDSHFRVSSVARDQGLDLWPFQRASVEYILANFGSGMGAIDADEPGLGKTPTAIVVANEMQAKKVLVVCPATIRRQWLRRIQTWATSSGVIYAIETSKNAVHPDATWTVISWDLIASPGIWRSLASQEYDLLILDEAHKAKTAGAKRSRALWGGGKGEPVAAPLIECARHILPLTGTPAPNRPRELYPLILHTHWETIDYLSEVDFNELYNPRNLVTVSSGGKYVEEAVGRFAELQNRLRANCMVRHLKRDVMPQLEYPVYDVVVVDKSAAVKAALEAEKLLELEGKLKFGPGGDWDIPFDAHMSTIRKMMGVAIAPQASAYCADLLDQGEKLVVFAHHIEVLDILIDELAAYSPIRIDGSHSAKQKDLRVQEFVNNPARRVLVGNMLSLGTGTDELQHASAHCILVEPDWVPGNNQQAIDRLDRGGQKRQVQADLFVAPGSILEEILNNALGKAQVLHRALDMRVQAA